ncbi:MAG: MFS transporter [Desulfomonile tiedjei]|nr:MFS transporter [Desulfomonile tiedjei]
MKSQLHLIRESCDIAAPTATKFVILIGVVSLFSDLTYEGARSVTGPFLATLGASGTVVGLVAGLGELIGYSLRLASGYFADRTQKYWTIVFFGYGMNLLAVPLLALAGRWEIAAMFMIAERMGKAIRTPARDVMLACASDSIGRGWGFGLHEALDQIGAVVGPLVLAAVMFSQGGYQAGFALLLIPALLALTFLFTAYQLFPTPHGLESAAVKLQTEGFPRSFWLYIAAIGCVAAGFADFPLVAYHFKKVASVPEHWIPIFYAVAMGVDAIAALIFGRLFDRLGIAVLVAAVLLSSLFAPLVFLGGFQAALVGMALWGVGMGAQESIVRAAIAEMVPRNRLGFAFGLFNTAYGVAWFLGSALMGFLYDASVTGLVIFSVVVQLVAVPVILLSLRGSRP